jgi:hypothetical protein
VIAAFMPGFAIASAGWLISNLAALESASVSSGI